MTIRTPYPELMLSGMPIVAVPYLEDDLAYVSNERGIGKPVLLVGTKPPTGSAAVRREARLLVRRGLADVLEWLGQPVVNEPVLAMLQERSYNAGIDLDL